MKPAPRVEKSTRKSSTRWTFFALVGALFGCFETKLIPAEPAAGGAGGALAAGEGGVSDTAGAAGLGEEAGAPVAGGTSSGGGGRPSAGSGGLATGGAGNGKGGSVASGGGVTTGGRGGTGGASTTGGVAASGGAATGGAGTASGGSGGQGLPKVDWLTFVGSDAPSGQGVNGSLGINGVLYAYADTCATLNWNAQTRCASGKLCEPANGANWGIAVGFDFRNTGPGGTPPDTKQLWNPNDVGALGVAWEISGTAPSLQIWVLNMDPIWGGQCNTMSCDIAGPPDGIWTPPRAGQLLFSNMEKDDWGGSGIPYVYDPAKVHALQFKLPAIIAGAASFSFCVEGVGVIH